MKFHGNGCVAIHTKDLKKAETFYKDVLGLKLVSRSRNHLEFKMGKVMFYINRDTVARAPIPSFTVKDLAKARTRLRDGGAKIVEDRGASLYFQDPSGVVFDVVEK